MGATVTTLTTKLSNDQTLPIVWLDSNVKKTTEHINLQHSLRAKTNLLSVFENLNKCEQHIKQQSESDHVILIVSGTLGQQLIPRIHELPQLLSVYIFCGDETKHRVWATRYTKVLDVITDPDQLLEKIFPKTMLDKVTHDQVDITVYDEHGTTTTELNGQFVHSQLLIDCLLRMHPAETDKDELIALCMKRLKDNEEQLALLHDFKRDYLPSQAVYWYTSHSFLFSMLNKALRTQDIDLIFLFRFFIRDIRKQLEENQCSMPVNVYRGQWMTIQELERLKESIGKLISVNSFFSTSKNKACALGFLDDNNDLEAVLFQIDANPLLAKNRPVADISHISFFKTELEVLFMLGSVFRLHTIVRNDDESYWTVNLTLCTDDDQCVKTIIDDMKNEYSDADGETDLLSFGIVLWRMSQFDKATQYFQRLLSALPRNHESIARCYYNLGVVADEKGDYDVSLQWYQKWLEFTKRIFERNDPRLGDIYICMGGVHDKKGDWKRAIEAFNKALSIFNEAHGDNSLKVALCFNNVGNVYQTLGKYSAALECHQKALAIHESHHVVDHPRLGLTHNNIGIDYQALGQHFLALAHLEKSLEIKSKSLPPNHPDMAKTLASMGHVYMNQNDFQKALFYFEEAAKIFRKAFSSDHPCVIQVEEDIQHARSHVH